VFFASLVHSSWRVKIARAKDTSCKLTPKVALAPFQIANAPTTPEVDTAQRGGQWTINAVGWGPLWRAGEAKERVRTGQHAQSL
jgi:hypothetical protein